MSNLQSYIVFVRLFGKRLSVEKAGLWINAEKEIILPQPRTL